MFCRIDVFITLTQSQIYCLRKLQTASWFIVTSLNFDWLNQSPFDTTMFIDIPQLTDAFTQNNLQIIILSERGLHMSQSAIVSMLETNSSAKRTFRMFDSDLIIATMDYFYNKTLTFATHIQAMGRGWLRYKYPQICPKYLSRNS